MKEVRSGRAKKTEERKRQEGNEGCMKERKK
jgi:hypothetical protein